MLKSFSNVDFSIELIRVELLANTFGWELRGDEKGK